MTKNEAELFLTGFLNGLTKGKGASAMPRHIELGQSLYDAYVADREFAKALEDKPGVRTFRSMKATRSETAAGLHVKVLA
jgi:hypothetical protein